MQSQIDPTGIDSTFPIVDKNQPSAGFRSNFSSIKSNLVFAKSEITNLQTTYIEVKGDVFSSPSDNQPLGQTDGVITLTLSLSPDSTNGTGGTYDSTKNGISYTVNPSGTLSNVKIIETGSLTPINTNDIITFTKTSPDSTYAEYPSIKNITVSTLSIDSFGRIISTGTKEIGDFNLFGYYLPNNSILLGNSSNISTALTSSSINDVLINVNNSLTFTQLTLDMIKNISTTGIVENDILVYDGTSWKPQAYGAGTVINVTAGPGLKIINSNSTPEISYYFDGLTKNTTFDGSEILIIEKNSQYNSAQLSDISNYIVSSSISDIDTNKQSANDIVMYNNSTKKLYKLPLSTLNYSSNIYVSPEGDDVNGDGTYINPYKTITNALTKNSSSLSLCITLFSGTYTEDISSDVGTLFITSLDSRAILTGNFTITSGTTILNNLIFNLGNNLITSSGTSPSLLIDSCEITSNNVSILFSGSIGQTNITNSAISGIITNSSTGNIFINNLKSKYTNSFNINSGNTYLSNIQYIGYINHNGGSIYIDSCNLINAGTLLTSTSSTATDILSITNSITKTIASDGNETFFNFTKKGTCPYYISNSDINNLYEADILGPIVSYRDTSFDNPKICPIVWPLSTDDDDYDSNNTTDITLQLYNKVTQVTTSTNCNIILPIPSIDINYLIELNLILIPNGATDVTFENVTWEPATPNINYTSNSTNIFKFMYLPSSTSWIGFSINNPSIELDTNTNNLLQHTSSGYMVDLEATADITNQYVSSSTGDDTTGDGTESKPFKTLYKALSRIPDNTSSTINLYSGDTFIFTDGFPDYVENGTLSQIGNGNYFLSSRKIIIKPYNNTIYDSIASHPGVTSDNVDIGTQPIIEFTYSIASDTNYHVCPGFSINYGSLQFIQIGITISTKNLSTTNIVPLYYAPIATNNGIFQSQACTYNLATGAVFASDEANSSTGLITIGGTCQFNTTNGKAFLNAACGYTLRAPFSDISGGVDIIVNGTDTGLKQRSGNFNSTIANNNSFMNLTVINAASRTYLGLNTQNLITTS